jgi:hypothetical protein
VEVKGTTTAGESVLVTRNEVEHAKRMFPAIALAVVSGIVLRGDADGVPTAEGGILTVLEPWDVTLFELRPFAFECVIVGPDGVRSGASGGASSGLEPREAVWPDLASPGS